MSEISDGKLQQELPKKRLDREQQFVEASIENSINVVTGAVGQSYWLQVSMEGVVVPALVDTGSQSTISLLYKIACHLKKLGKSLPVLEHPYSKGREAAHKRDHSGFVYPSRGWQVYHCTSSCTA